MGPMKFLSDLFAVVLSIFAAIIVGVWWSYIEQASQFERDQVTTIRKGCSDDTN